MQVVPHVVSMSALVVRLYRGKGARQYIGAEELTTYPIPMVYQQQPNKPKGGTLSMLI